METNSKNNQDLPDNNEGGADKTTRLGKENLVRGLKMLQQQYASKPKIPIYDGMRDKIGRYSKAILEEAMRKDGDID